MSFFLHRASSLGIIQKIVFDLELTDRIPDVLYEGLDRAIQLDSVFDERVVARKLGDLRFYPCASPEFRHCQSHRATGRMHPCQISPQSSKPKFLASLARKCETKLKRSRRRQPRIVPPLPNCAAK